MKASEAEINNAVKQAIERARSAQPGWEQLGFNARARAIKKAGKQLLIRRHEAMDLISREAGKTSVDALLSEAVGPLQYIQDWIKLARPYLKPRKLGISAMAFPGKSGTLEFLPRGVVGVIAPWNFPLGNFFKPVFPALLCGNAVVIKPSEYSPRTCEWFVKIMNEFLPPGVLTYVHGGAEEAQALIRSGIDALTFTGSYHSGRQVAALAGQQMIPVSLELGGKDAAIVLADCDLDRTLAGVLHWSLQNTGQACGDIERVFIQETIADEFAARLSQAATALGDIGSLANDRQLQIVEDHVQDALSKGAKLLCGGKKIKGRAFETTVLDHCLPSMKVMTEPTFGPVIPLMRVRNAEEAVSLVNVCDYGLNASVWSRNEKFAVAIARRLQVGTAYVNNHAFTGAVVPAPWTGVKNSGYGVANSTMALHHYTRPRSLVVDRKKSADAWWQPGDEMAEEFGECLAEAQLGKVGSALKVPYLLFKRQAAVMKFIRQGKTPTSVESLKVPFKFRLINQILRLARKSISKMTDAEANICVLAIEAIYWPGARNQERKKPFIPAAPAEIRKIVLEFNRVTPVLMSITMRVIISYLKWSPILKLYKFKTLDRLSLEERVELMKRLSSSSSYLERQFLMLPKTIGAMEHARTTRFQPWTENSVEGLRSQQRLAAVAPKRRQPEPGRAEIGADL